MKEQAQVTVDREPRVADARARRGTTRLRPTRKQARPLSFGNGEHRTLSVLASSSALLSAQLAPRSPRDSTRRRALALGDVLALVIAAGATVLLLPPADPAAWLPLLAAVPLWVVVNKLLGLYDRDAHVIHKSTLDEFPGLLQSIGLGTALLVLVSPVAEGVHIGRAQAVLFAAVALMATLGVRTAARAGVRNAFAPERCLVVGSGTVAGLVAHKINCHPEHGVELVGYVDDVDGPAAGELDRLGDLAEFEQVCRTHDIERVVIAFSSISHELLLDVIRASKLLNVKITVVPRLFEMLGHAVELDQVQGMTLLGLRGLGRTRSSLAAKRVIDVAGAGLGLIALAPVMLVLALAVKLTSRGPVLFAQARMGRKNQQFRMLKFRTMVEGADAMKASLRHLNEADGPMFKIADDPRITGIGRFLRKTSLDELPQLWNVLRGDMSLVGPRPLVPDENEALIGWHRARLELTPGLTGPWQVLGRTAIPFTEMVKLDYHYVADWSLWNDLKLIVRTIPVVLRRRGA